MSTSISKQQLQFPTLSDSRECLWRRYRPKQTACLPHSPPGCTQYIYIYIYYETVVQAATAFPKGYECSVTYLACRLFQNLHAVYSTWLGEGKLKEDAARDDRFGNRWLRLCDSKENWPMKASISLFRAACPRWRKWSERSY